MLLSWKALPQGCLPQEVVATTCECFKDILKVRDKLHHLRAQARGRFRLVPLTPLKERGTKWPDGQGMRRGGGGGVEVSPTRAWVAVAFTDRPTTYKASFGLHNFQVISATLVSTLKAKNLVVLRVLDMVPTYLMLYVVCSSQCHIDLLLNLDAWLAANRKYRDGPAILGAFSLSRLHELV